MIRILVGAIAIACGCMLASSDEQSAMSGGDATSSAMRFEWRQEGPAEQCGMSCRTWISATGVISEDTASDFADFLRDRDAYGATLVLDSEGGSVLAALTLGRAIRNLDMTTTVGRTKSLPAGQDGSARATISPHARCESMCVFLLLAGQRRYVPPEAKVLVHQIWLGSKSKHAQEVSYTAAELELVQRDIGRLARYTIEMGGGIELLETALRVPPWEPMHLLSADEMRRTRLTTVDTLFGPEIPQARAVPAVKSGLTTSAQAQPSD